MCTALAVHLLSLARPPTSSSLQIIDNSFQYSSPCLWNQRPASLWQPRTSFMFLCLRLTFSCKYHLFLCLFSSPISPSLFHSRLRTCLFHKSFPLTDSFPPSRLTPLSLYCAHRFFSAYFFVLVSLGYFFYFLLLIPCGRLRWLMSAFKHM